MAWSSTQQNQSPFRLAHQKGSNLFPGLKSCNVAGTDIQQLLSDKVKILGPR